MYPQPNKNNTLPENDKNILLDYLVNVDNKLNMIIERLDKMEGVSTSVLQPIGDIETQIEKYGS
tara:strand:+ start:68 stop:259 length:192 start_codon:yes stop_codon:yes gene_type:complete